jgi:hypothetical protein
MKGEPSSLMFDVTAKTEPGTTFNIPVTDVEELTNYSFIKYVSSDTSEAKMVEDDYKVNLTGMQMNFNLKLTQDAVLKIVFDPAMGDIIEGTGTGDLKVAINTLGDFTINGEYVIESGKYPFTLQNVLLNREFVVERGSTLRWTGDPINCDVDIKTYYDVDANLSQLDPGIVETEGVDNVDVQCQLQLKGKLMQPDIKYNIELPNVNQTVKDRVESSIATEEQKTKQFIALLFMHRFLPIYSQNSESTGINSGDVAGVNASEVLSVQVSNWLSQLSDQVDIGFKYSPKTQLSEQEAKVIFGKTLMNNRLTINGSVGTYAESQEATSYVGDVDIDYKITKNGKIRTKAYNRSNNDVTQSDLVSKYTQGVGVFYIEEFDTFSELVDRLFKRKNKKQSDNEKATGSIDAIKPEEAKTE